ncbi:MAG TPA: ABC transporter permease [Candidatus Angelobacter sp.]|nr:ABC transporter permease [Candidatus Angelobacter sp.]
MKTPVKAAASCAAVLVLWAVLNAVLPHGAPAGIILSGLVFGAINSLVAVSIVLVYRASRVVNFAAAEFGSVAAVVAIELHVQTGVGYFVSIAAGLVLAAVLGAVIELAILRRFAAAPRLIVAVVTIGLAQVLNGASVVIPYVWHSGNAGTFTTPFTAHFHVFPVLFSGDYVVAMVVAPIVLGGLTWFLRATHYGVAIRAAADNGDRARLLGIPVRRLSTIIWTIAGVLSALAVLLRVPIVGFASFTSVSNGGAPLLLQTLTAAVVGGMSNLPVTVLAALGLGVVDQLSAWTFHDGTYTDVVLLGIVLLMLLVRRGTFSRAADAAVSTWQSIRPVRPVPPELANLRSVRLGRGGLMAMLLALAVIIPYVLPPARTQLVALVVIYAIVGCSLVVLTGFAGHISLGQVAFMGLGGAITGLLVGRHGVDMFVALGIGAAAASAAAFVVGIPALRISGPFLAVTTLAFAVAGAQYFLSPLYFPWLKPTDTLPKLSVFGRVALSSDRQLYFLCLVALVVVLTAVRGLRASHAGRAMVASQDNRRATQAFAIDTTRSHLVAFAVSGAIAGLAGGLLVIQQQGYSAGNFTALQGLQFFTMVVIGGLGSLPGTVLGAVYVYGAQYLLPPGWSLLATGAGIVVLLMFFPGGLGDIVYRGRDAVLRVIARRRGLVVPSLVADTRRAAAADAMPVPLRRLTDDVPA